ncbi:guanitoxin biosynthesis heme-dependent pre-guanitoxin N-hydroxylase GntA [Nocardia sp. NPDC046473]|uniref:guanitoxin biosynthesis heme-dependent pre-guanitoxin N-hydroxylase GntA n=1 Tax=Nocardia sp. NPDC046473 TaxID=3155733 RepID=UPI0033DCCEEB
MASVTKTQARAELEEFIQSKPFSCLGARAALKRDTITHGHYQLLGDEESAKEHHQDLAEYARSLPGTLSDKSFRTFVATFDAPGLLAELEFEQLLWQHLQLVHDIDSKENAPDTRFASDPGQSTFGFQTAGHAFFVVGLHPGASRASRRFTRIAAAFNSNVQFVLMGDSFTRMQEKIRGREVTNNGSVNPSFTTYEYTQPARHFSGRFTEDDWKCPFQSRS